MPFRLHVQFKNLFLYLILEEEEEQAAKQISYLVNKSNFTEPATSLDALF